jgi:hypothetical protein
MVSRFETQRHVVLRDQDGRNRPHTLSHAYVTRIQVPTWIGRAGFGAVEFVWTGKTNVQGLPVFRCDSWSWPTVDYKWRDVFKNGAGNWSNVAQQRTGEDTV